MPKLARNTGIVGGLTLLSRLFGFFRDLIVARLLGAGDLSDTFFVAFRIPNLLRSLFAEGAMTSAFVPVMAEQKEAGRAALNSTLRAASGLLLLGSLAATVLGVMYTPQIIELFAPGFGATAGKMQKCVELTQIMLPYIVFVAFTTMINGALNTVGVFGASAAAQVLMNIVLIIGGLVAGFFDLDSAVNILAASVIVGGVVQVLAQFPALRKNGLSILPSFQIFVASNFKILKLLLPAVFGAALYQIVIFVNTVLASMLPNGAVSWLFYADRVTQLPIGVFTVALSSVLLPTLSKSAASNDAALFSKDLSDSLRYTSFVIAPLAASLIVIAEPLVSVLFERGAFTAHDSLMTAASIQALSLGLWATSIHSMMSRAFFAKKDSITPTAIGVLSLIVGISVSLLLMGRPTHVTNSTLDGAIVGLQNLLLGVFPGGSFGHVGLSYASSVSATVSVMLSLSMIKRAAPTTSFTPFLLSTGKTFAAAGAAAWSASLVPVTLSPTLRLGMMIATGAVVLILALKALRSRELEEISAKLLKRAGRQQ